MSVIRHVAEDVKTASNILLGNEQAIRLYDGTGAYVGLAAPADLTGSGVNYTYTMPVSYGTNGYVMTTDGAGALSWTQNGNVAGTGTANYVAKFTAATTIGDSNIFSSGTFVGIGTAIPSANLHIYDAPAYIIVETSDGDEYAATKYDSATRSWQVGQEQVTHYFGIRDLTSAALRLVIDTSGNVGMGVASPNAKLHIDGDVKIDNASNGVLLKDSNGTYWRITVNTNGTLSTTSL